MPRLFLKLADQISKAERGGVFIDMLYQRLARLESALFEHMHLENNVLFPRALNE